MIADQIGVTKAAVYHQYQTKDEIVLAAAEDELARLEAVIASAETEASEMEARDRLVTGIVDLVVERRRTVSTILSDPVIVGFFADHEEFRDDMHRLRRLLIADKRGPEARVRTVVPSPPSAVPSCTPSSSTSTTTHSELSSCASHTLSRPTRLSDQSSTRLLQVHLEMVDLACFIEFEDGQRVDHVGSVAAEVPLLGRVVDETG